MMKFKVFLLLFLIIDLSFVFAFSPLVNPDDAGLQGMTLSQNYDEMLDALFSNNNVITTIDNKLWVPWFKTSISSGISDLQSGSNCDSDVPIDFTHNCMVTDEFSQVGVLISMGKNQERMNQFYNTVIAISSTNGIIPSWRVYRNGNQIETCKPGINGNCDTASDGTSRIIISLFTASTNSLFTDKAMKAKYKDLAIALTKDFVRYEVDNSCRSSNFGKICHWLAAGSESKNAGLTSTDFGYTGYYPDAIIAMLSACSITKNGSYCDIANDFALNYLQAANYDGKTFSAPPGRSFRWENISSKPLAKCTNSCSPIEWDSADAPRALGLCLANYYSKQLHLNNTILDDYCKVWGTKYMTDPTAAPVQFSPDGKSGKPQNGYFAQGLQALFESGGHDQSLFAKALYSALGHYSFSKKTWDYTASFGVYSQAFAVRALGIGIGRDSVWYSGKDINSFASPSLPTTTKLLVQPNQNTTQSNPSIKTNDVTSLKFEVRPSGTLVGDYMDGTTCRKVQYNTATGWLEGKVCLKQDKFELMLLSKPHAANLCIDNNCVGAAGGFASFGMSKISGAVTQTPLQAPALTEISSLKFEIKPSGSLVGDYMDGKTCRKVQYNTATGWLEAKVCAKDDHYEMYLLSTPCSSNVCIGTYCVGSNSGFASFKV